VNHDLLGVRVVSFSDEAAKALRAVEYKQLRPGVWRREARLLDGTVVRQTLFTCQDCSTNKPGFFMVKDVLWHATVPEHGVICLRCFELRLGRRVADDEWHENEDLRICAKAIEKQRSRQ
jgi:hypothetical protein